MPPDTSANMLLCELGTEEIPAGFLSRAMADLRTRLPAALAEARLEHGEIDVWGTPRRLAFAVANLASGQPDLEEQIVGPPVRAAFDKDGAPTKAALGFAQKNGLDPDALERAEVPGKKGEYLVGTRKTAGKATQLVLPDLVAEVLSTIPWPKSMRWGWSEHAYVRPVHWLVVLYQGEVLPVEVVGVRAGRHSRGHRFLAPDAIALDGDAASYVRALRSAFVIVDPERRRTMIEAELGRIEQETGARVRPDAELIDEVTNLVEYPVAVCGQFAEEFLEVPSEVVVSAMRSHQRYFAMEDEGGALLNRFVTIAGTVTADVEVVRSGNQRVLAARLADAQFFFAEDKKQPLTQLAGRLGGVVFQKKLGSIGDKVERVTSLAGHLAERFGVDRQKAQGAAALCKADLVSHMVGEFPELQGTMGKHYARLGGVDQDVCLAIEEHYLPRGSGGQLPTGALGAVVGVADRLDTLVGCFAVGLVPSGSADPYGLRRAALAILAILADRGWRVTMGELIDAAADRLTDVADAGAVREQVLEFFRTRLRGQLAESGNAVDCVEAALAAGFEDAVDAAARAQALTQLRSRADFEPLAVAFKRVANILKGEAAASAPNPDAFVEGEERSLWSSFESIRGRADERLGQGDYSGALQILAELKAPVDRFFDKVLVMDDDERIRNNRLALLGSINATFRRIADFRQLSV